MKLCLGTVQFGLDYGIQGKPKPKKDKIFEMLDYAMDSGICTLDTASAYGDAEVILGDYLSGNKSKIKRLEVVSKLKPDAFRAEPKRKWGDIAVRNAHKSLDILGIECFSAYLFHDASCIFDDQAVAALEEVKKAGLAERIGVSIYTPKEAIKALEYSSITAVQVPYNVFDHRLDREEFFERAKEQGTAIFARSPLLQGLLMMDPDRLPEKVAFAAGELRDYLRICEKFGIKPLDAALGYVWRRDDIDYMVFGVDNIKQLREYMSFRDTRIPLDMIKELTERYKEADERLVNPVLWK